MLILLRESFIRASVAPDCGTREDDKGNLRELVDSSEKQQPACP